MRATKKRYCKDNAKKSVSNNSNNKHKGLKKFSFIAAGAFIAVLLIVPTTTLAPNVDAFAINSASLLTAEPKEDVALILTKDTEPVEVATEPTVVETTVEPTTEAPTEEETTVEVTEAVEIVETVAVTEAPTKPVVVATESVAETEPEETIEEDVETVDQSGYLISIKNPDKNYKPKKLTLSDYDRAKLERLVMGEAGSMGFEGCALVAQTIRDSMIRSNTTSIDRIISEYQYYATTKMKPNKNVKDAVSYIFDDNGSAVQHRVLCFYVGTSQWHETQEFVVSCGKVRFFDLKVK